MAKTFIGARLRRLRAEQSLSQAQLARAVGLSTSYVNQLENDQRPATVPVLMKLTAAFEVDLHYFAADSDARLLADLTQFFHEHPELGNTADADIEELVSRMPSVARTLLTLSRNQIRPDAEQTTAFEQVRDLFYDRDNHIAPLDDAAEELFADARLAVGGLDIQLADLLRSRYDITTAIEPAPRGDSTTRRRYDPRSRVLTLAQHLQPGQRAFELATQLAYLSQSELIEREISAARGLAPSSLPVARVGLANYFAGALVLPYGRFLAAAESARYDIDTLCREFEVGFETVCHRLSTLQRSGQRGVPFFFIRTDRAGNISKRQSATAFHFSRVGGSCPLWVIHEAFSTPGRLRRQVAEMPDGRTYLWVARTTTPSGSSFLKPEKTFSIGLGCDIVHARKLIYSVGLDISDRSTVVPIGPGCKTCERHDCPQRAFPQLHHPIAVSDDLSSTLPYS